VSHARPRTTLGCLNKLPTVKLQTAVAYCEL